MKVDSDFIEKLVYYSQEEGLTDQEIADKLNCARSTVCRVKKECKLPRRNLQNRRDKSYVCPFCKETVYIRRKDPLRLMCDSCNKKKNFILDIIQEKL